VSYDLLNLFRPVEQDAPAAIGHRAYMDSLIVAYETSERAANISQTEQRNVNLRHKQVV
jgi:hypothetical protein